jgi:hypothetical protein
MAVDSKYNITELNQATKYFTKGKYNTYQALVDAMKGWTQSQILEGNAPAKAKEAYLKRIQIRQLLRKEGGKFVRPDISGGQFKTVFWNDYSNKDFIKDLKNKKGPYQIATDYYKNNKSWINKQMTGNREYTRPISYLAKLITRRGNKDDAVKKAVDNYRTWEKKQNVPYTARQYGIKIEKLLPLAHENGIVPRNIDTKSKYFKWVTKQKIDPLMRLFKDLEKIGTEHIGGISRAVDLKDYRTLGEVVPLLGGRDVNFEKGLLYDRPMTGLAKNIIKAETPGLQGANLAAFNKMAAEASKAYNVPVSEMRIGAEGPERITSGRKITDPLIKDAELLVKQYSAAGGTERPSFPKLGKALQQSIIAYGQGDTKLFQSSLKTALLDSVKDLSKSEQLRICKFASGGGVTGNCRQIINKDPVKATEIFSKVPGEATGALGKLKNTTKTFLGILGRGGAKVAPFAALAGAGAIAEPLVKQFSNDDPSTYLSNPDQQKGMLLSMLEAETPQVDEEILKYRTPALGAATAAGAIPGAKTLFQERRGVGPRGPLPEGVGKTRAALGIKGVLGKALGASFSPLAVAATLPMDIAAQRAGGSDIKDIASDPFNWMGPAFASAGSEMASKGIKNPLLLKALRLGMSPRALMLGSRFLGLPGLALTAGLTGYDLYKNRKQDLG